MVWVLWIQTLKHSDGKIASTRKKWQRKIDSRILTFHQKKRENKDLQLFMLLAEWNNFFSLFTFILWKKIESFWKGINVFGCLFLFRFRKSLFPVVSSVYFKNIRNDIFWFEAADSLSCDVSFRWSCIAPTLLIKM